MKGIENNRRMMRKEKNKTTCIPQFDLQVSKYWLLIEHHYKQRMILISSENEYTKVVVGDQSPKKLEGADNCHEQ